MPAAKVPPLDEPTFRPACVWLLEVLATVNVRLTVSPGATVVAEALSVDVTEEEALLPWQVPQPLA